MAVADGQQAGLAWESLVRGTLEQGERDKIKKALLEYCGQDTLAMVKLVDRLLLPPSTSQIVSPPAPTR